jgi:DNA-binding MarR family transcriptional regulator
MMSDLPQTHALRGFPAAAIKFVRALERNREKIATDRGLSASELRALFWIAEQGSARPKDLAAHMEMTTGGVTSVAQRLVEQGFLQRIAHPDDRRSLYLELTERGHSVMEQIHSEFNGMIADSTSMLDEHQLAAFESALWAVADEVAKRTAGNA